MINFAHIHTRIMAKQETHYFAALICSCYSANIVSHSNIKIYESSTCYNLHFLYCSLYERPFFNIQYTVHMTFCNITFHIRSMSISDLNSHVSKYILSDCAKVKEVTSRPPHRSKCMVECMK